MNDIECPYCGEGLDINHDDGYGYGEDETYQQECSNCGKTFVYNTSVSFNYDVKKAKCLNGGKHNYQLTHTYPKKYSKMRCEMCDGERQPTAEEIQKYKLNKEK